MAVRVRIYTAAIAAEFGRAGTVGKLAKKLGEEIKTVAEAAAPVGGTKSAPSAARWHPQRPIKGSHRLRTVPRSATFSTSFFVENTSDHAAFVHEGTSGPILPIGRLVIGGEPRLLVQLGGERRRLAHSVRGQEANPWLRKAANSVLREYGVPPVGPTFRS